MKLGMHRKKLNKIRAAALVVLAAILCFAGCSTGQNSAGAQGSTTAQGSKMKIGYSMYYDSGFTEEDEAEIRKLLTEDESLSDLVTAE